MNKKTCKMISGIFLGICLTVSFSADVFAQQETIKVTKTDRMVDGTNVDDPVWTEASVKDMSLATAPPVHEAISGTAAVLKLKVQAVTDKKNLYVRLKWQDGSQNARIKGLNDFRDAVAIQFPMDRKVTTSLFMGEKGKKVRIWRWAADNVVENLSAEGFGTLTKSETQYLKGAGKYRDGEWVVVISRSLTASVADEIALGQTLPVAFAVWDGGNEERDGFKAVTLEWAKMQF
ncbi:MAG TPA: ethylbenzene dehydrogenase-related protein [Thermodesulfobacteriota bacterium]|nr:ethylbenzene dehydrogenase-related protein [Thermodesulfobacteriota bacterium]